MAVYVGGAWYVFGGTSASSPIIAGVYALAGRPGAGTYPASFLYADTAHLYDVTSGNNSVWEGLGIHCSVTYLCNGVVGYDGPTGLGTPNGVHAFAAPTVGATHLVVSGFPSPTTAGASHSLTVTAKDAGNTTDGGYLGTALTRPTRAALPADHAFIAGDLGVHVFNVTLNTVGTRSITATDTLTSSITVPRPASWSGTVTRQPDGRIRLGTTGHARRRQHLQHHRTQPKARSARPRSSRQSRSPSRFKKNDGSAQTTSPCWPAEQRVLFYGVTYFHGTTNITTAVVAGTYTTPCR